MFVTYVHFLVFTVLRKFDFTLAFDSVSGSDFVSVYPFLDFT